MTQVQRRRKVKGRLYKRDKNGREHEASSAVHGIYWLQYTINGERKRQKLTDINGDPIKDFDEARAAADKVLAPFTTSDEVERLKAIKARLADAEERRQEAERTNRHALPLDQAWDVYVQSPSRPDSGKATLANYNRHYTKFLGWLEKEHPETCSLADVTDDIAREFAQCLDDSSLSANTYNKRIGFLRLFFRIMGEEKRCEGNPFAKLRRKRMRMNSRKELTVEQIFKLLSTAQGELALLLGLGYFTGLRRGDCCTLLWSEVDLVRGVIKRVPNKTRDRTDHPEPVKVGIAPDLLNALALIPPEKRQGYVLPGMAELYNDPSRRDRISRMITAHFEICGLTCVRAGTGRCKNEKGKFVNTGKRAIVDYGFHSLRYSYISHHAERGTPQAVIQANAGHRNPAMTEHYTRISDDTARQVAAALVLPWNEFPEQTGGKMVSDENQLRERLSDLVQTLPLDAVRCLLDQAEKAVLEAN